MLFTVTAALAAGAVLFARRDTAPGRHATAPLLQGLEVAAATSVRITAAGGHPVATLRPGPGGWTLAEREGYAADPARVRRLLDALAALRSVELKTTSPARYAVLGVEDPARPDAQGLRIEIASGDQRRALIVGKRAATLGTYVRLDGDPQAHAALPALDIPRETALWLDRTLLDLPAAEVAGIDVAPATGPAYRLQKAAREDAHLRLEDLPPGRALYDEAIADPQAALLEDFVIDDLRPAADAWTKAASARYTGFDGLIVELEGLADREHCRLRLHAATAAGATPASVVLARNLNARAGGREFEVAAYRCEGIFKARDGFLK